MRISRSQRLGVLSRHYEGSMYLSGNEMHVEQRKMVRILRRQVAAKLIKTAFDSSKQSISQAACSVIS
ncbi:hypothetical protein XAP6984_250043 [Xanthomonas phaseoli pv. phaseoli]|uniref:Transposase n=1 Tax=Xanthomonas campestris pv. phaseoli TaxID=317013 RepID=A0ABY1TPD4_XANCH|nr:hypothetical protein XAP6984_250043 [Xanthomonas phaseoli pv. phaseoli]